MKKAVIILVIIVLAVATAYSQYGITDPSALRSESSIQISINVECIPILITPHLLQTARQSLTPGDNLVYAQDEKPLGYFVISFAKGYHHSVEYLVEAIGHPDGPKVLLDTYGEYKTENKNNMQKFVISSGAKQKIEILSGETNTANLEVFAKRINVPVGALGGERKWNIKCTAEYE